MHKGAKAQGYQKCDNSTSYAKGSHNVQLHINQCRPYYVNVLKIWEIKRDVYEQIKKGHTNVQKEVKNSYNKKESNHRRECMW